MSRLIVAPVGLQPAAVLAPLLSEPLRPRPGDRVILIASPDSDTHARRVEEETKRDLGSFSCEVSSSDPFRLDPSVRSLLAEASGECSETWLLINGGRGEWMREMIALWHASRGFRIVESRDHQAFVLGEGGELDGPFPVNDLGRDRLLSFLGVSFERRRMTRRRPGAPPEHLDDVMDVQERAGQLFAALDATDWKVNDYRRYLLDWRKLQRLGLEPRRVLLIGAAAAMWVRARQDGIPVERMPSKMDAAALTAWKAEATQRWAQRVREGSAIGLAESQLEGGRLGRAFEVTGRKGLWEGRSLVVTMGTQPGTTLQAVWAHRPRALTLQFDERQPRSFELARRLSQEPLVGASAVRGVPIPVTNAEVGTGAADVNVTPGDKLARAALILWDLGDRDRRRVWELHGRHVRRADTAPERDGEECLGEPVPLETWVRFSAPGTVDYRADGHALPPGWPEAAWELLSWFGTTNDLDGLDRFWLRRKPPRLAKSTLVLPGAGAPRKVDLEQMSEQLLAAFVKHPRNGSNGEWWEWVVGAVLAAHGADEVRLGVTVQWPWSKGDGFRDELDVVTRHGGQYGYWSCKTRTRGLYQDLQEARAQADRLLGRQRLAVVAVPRVLSQAIPGMEQAGAGHWRARELGHVVDARFLRDLDQVLQLAGMDEFHHPGP